MIMSKLISSETHSRNGGTVPDMCWRYLPQSQLLKKLPSWSRDPYSGFDAIV